MSMLPGGSVAFNVHVGECRIGGIDYREFDGRRAKRAVVKSGGARIGAPGLPAFDLLAPGDRQLDLARKSRIALAPGVLALDLQDP
jgi:hypothetical protein